MDHSLLNVKIDAIVFVESKDDGIGPGVIARLFTPRRDNFIVISHHRNSAIVIHKKELINYYRLTLIVKVSSYLSCDVGVERALKVKK